MTEDPIDNIRERLSYSRDLLCTRDEIDLLFTEIDRLRVAANRALLRKAEKVTVPKRPPRRKDVMPPGFT